MNELRKFQRIAICDDETASLNSVKKCVEECLLQYGMDFETYLFQSAKTLWESMKKRFYDICFLDIDMPEINGLELAERISEGEGHKPLIVFVSCREDYVFQSFRVHPFSFVRKSCFGNDMKQTIADLAKFRKKEQKQQGETVKVADEAGHEYQFPRESILYLMAEGKYINFVLTDGKKLVRCSLKSLERELSAYGFVRCHKSYIVNIQKVYAVKHDHLVLTDKLELPIRRGMVSELKRQLCSAMLQ